jgi:hypothetical protein
MSEKHYRLNAKKYNRIRTVEIAPSEGKLGGQTYGCQVKDCPEPAGMTISLNETSTDSRKIDIKNIRSCELCDNHFIEWLQDDETPHILLQDKVEPLMFRTSVLKARPTRYEQVLM